MSDSKRKKSPRAPSIPLGEAIERAMAVYEKEQRHAAPTDVVAKDLGYKSANNGAALTTIASLSYYGLLDRPEPGKLAVSAQVQSYHYAPNQDMRKELVQQWLINPPVFRDLLERYEGGLPSDATIRYDLIQEGFKPGTAESVIKAFKDSVEFAGYYESQVSDEPAESSLDERSELTRETVAHAPRVLSLQKEAEENLDRIPVRLDANRRAWLEIPYPFYEADKRRLKAQIDLLLTDSEGNEASQNQSC